MRPPSSVVHITLIYRDSHLRVTLLSFTPIGERDGRETIGKRAAVLTIRPSTCDFIDRFRTSCPIIRTGLRDVLKGRKEIAIPACFKDRTPSIVLVERPRRGKKPLAVRPHRGSRARVSVVVFQQDVCMEAGVCNRISRE